MKYIQKIESLYSPLLWRGLGEAFIILLLFVSCSDDNEFNAEYQCYFTFDTNIHNTSILRNALNSLAPGTFAYVSTTLKNGGVRYVSISLNDGKNNEETAITTAEETRRSYILGINNGLIIGYGSLSNGTLYAFDHQCPNCVREYALYKYPLNWTNNGNWVICKNCQRTYDLNNGGFIVEGEKGSKLIRYRINYNGNILIVHN